MFLFLPFQRIYSWYLSKNSLPYWCMLLCDFIIVFVATLATYWLFQRTGQLFDHRIGVLYTSLFYAAVSLIGARVFRTYSGIVRYSSFVDLKQVAFANIITFLIVVVISRLLSKFLDPSYAVISVRDTFIIFVLATMGMWSVRILIKNLYDLMPAGNQRVMRVLIYGALTGGVGLAKNIRSQRPLRFRLCGFISHDNKMKQMLLMGERVYGVNDDLGTIVKKKHIEAILVSPLRTDDFRSNQKLQDTLIDAGCRIFMAQQAKEAAVEDGQLTLSDMNEMVIKEVSVEDLLPRQEIKVDLKSVAEQLTGCRVLVTGSAGSIGTEIVRQVASFNPSLMILIDQAETPQHDIRLMMAKEFPELETHAIVTSICHPARMEKIFAKYQPDYVFHAAAYKHVPMMEDNPAEAVLNNIYGTKVIADLSVKYGVKKFVMISTDKAVNPTNVMGCSKRICEIYCQSLNSYILHQTSYIKHQTQFVTTRFGNVLGSNGSVIPLFRQQIKEGGPVTVTDERIVRFFMLIPEACKLVLEAGTIGNGGEIFVFDMGQPVKIADLARRMIALSGAKNVEIKFTGLREGEKLYEEVLNELEGTKPTFHEKIRIAQVREYDYQQVCAEIDELIDIAKSYEPMVIVKKMKEIVPEYKSNNSIYEQLDHPEGNKPS